MSSPSASSMGPNPSSASIHSNAAVPSSPSLSTGTAGGGGGGGGVPPTPTTNTTTSSMTNLPNNTNNTTTTTNTTVPNTNNPPPPAPSNPELTARAHSALTTALTSLGNKHLAPLRSRAQDIHTNATRISAQTTSLEKSSQGLAKDSAALEKEAGKAGEVLKGLGDLQNWAEVMEWELGVLERTMDLVEGVGDEEDEEWLAENEEGLMYEGSAGDAEEERFEDDLVEDAEAFERREQEGDFASAESEGVNSESFKIQSGKNEQSAKGIDEPSKDHHSKPEALLNEDSHPEPLDSHKADAEPSSHDQSNPEPLTVNEESHKPSLQNASSTHKPLERGNSETELSRDAHRNQELQSSEEGVPELRKHEPSNDGKESFEGEEQQQQHHPVGPDGRATTTAPPLASATSSPPAAADTTAKAAAISTGDPNLPADAPPERATTIPAS